MAASEFEICRNDLRSSHGPTDSSALGKMRLVQKPGLYHPRINVTWRRKSAVSTVYPCTTRTEGEHDPSLLHGTKLLLLI